MAKRVKILIWGVALFSVAFLVVDGHLPAAVLYVVAGMAVGWRLVGVVRQHRRAATGASLLRQGRCQEAEAVFLKQWAHAPQQSLEAKAARFNAAYARMRAGDVEHAINEWTALQDAEAVSLVAPVATACSENLAFAYAVHGDLLRAREHRSAVEKEAFLADVAIALRSNRLEDLPDPVPAPPKHHLDAEHIARVTALLQAVGKFRTNATASVVRTSRPGWLVRLW